MINKKQKLLEKLIVVGDRVLIKPKRLSNKSKGGLFLPPGYKEKEEIQTGYIIKCGPGYPIPFPSEEADESWKNIDDKVKYVPLQAKVGDLAIFLQKGAIEIVYDNEKYFIVPNIQSYSLKEMKRFLNRKELGILDKI